MSIRHNSVDPHNAKWKLYRDSLLHNLWVLSGWRWCQKESGQVDYKYCSVFACFPKIDKVLHAITENKSASAYHVRLFTRFWPVWRAIGSFSNLFHTHLSKSDHWSSLPQFLLALNCVWSPLNQSFFSSTLSSVASFARLSNVISSDAPDRVEKDIPFKANLIFFLCAKTQNTAILPPFTSLLLYRLSVT